MAFEQRRPKHLRVKIPEDMILEDSCIFNDCNMSSYEKDAERKMSEILAEFNHATEMCESAQKKKKRIRTPSPYPSMKRMENDNESEMCESAQMKKRIRTPSPCPSMKRMKNDNESVKN